MHKYTAILRSTLLVIFFAFFLLPKGAGSNDWPRSYADNESTRFSHLDQLNKRTVRRLEKLWSLETPSDRTKVQSTNQATPIFVDGKIVASGRSGWTLAIDPESGKQIWKTKLGDGTLRSRGITSTELNSRKLILVPTNEGLFGLEASTGIPATELGNNGLITKATTNTPPIVSKGRLYLATTGAPSVIIAVDLKSHQEKWRTPLKGWTAPRVWSGFSMDEENDLLFALTSNPSGVVRARNRSYQRNSPDYSASVVALSAQTGKIVWHFQETKGDLWDLDLAGSPIITNLRLADGERRVVVALSKTGQILLLNAKTGEPIHKNSIRHISTPAGDYFDRTNFKTQLQVDRPERISTLQIDPSNDFRTPDEQSRKFIELRTRHARFEQYTPLSLNWDVAMYGLHGGATRAGGSLDKDSGNLIIPVNHDSWIIRLHHYDLILKWIDQLTDLFVKKKTTGNEGIHGEKSFKYEWEKDKNDFKSGEKVYFSLPVLGRNKAYKNACASCHGLARQGYIEHEAIGDTYYPPLVGIFGSKKFATLESVAAFDYAHQFAEPRPRVNAEQLKQVRDYISSADRWLSRLGLLRVYRRWQLLLGHDGYPATKPPWGTLVSLSLADGKINWRVPLGRRVNSRGETVAMGDISFGGALATAGGVVFVTGTPDEFARAYDSSSGRVLWEEKLPLAGSTAPMTFLHRGCQIVTFMATGGDFYGFKGKGPGVLLAYKDRLCHFK